MKATGSSKKPRLCVFRSNRHIYCQLIDDMSSKTLVSASDRGIKAPKAGKEEPGAKIQRRGKTAVAFEVGKLAAEKAIKEKIKEVRFDRRYYKYHGRVKALAEGAREGGLKF